MFRIRPQNIRQGTEITVEWTAAKFNTIEVLPQDLALGAFEVPLKMRNGHQIAQFTLDVPGSYEIKAGQTTRTITVGPQVDLDFHVEFGLTVVLVLGALLWVLLWAKKKKTGHATKRGD